MIRSYMLLFRFSDWNSYPSLGLLWYSQITGLYLRSIGKLCLTQGMWNGWHKDSEEIFVTNALSRSLRSILEAQCFDFTISKNFTMNMRISKRSLKTSRLTTCKHCKVGFSLRITSYVYLKVSIRAICEGSSRWRIWWSFRYQQNYYDPKWAHILA